MKVPLDYLFAKATIKHPLGIVIALAGGWPFAKPYCHIELCFPDGMCFSSASRGDGFIGTRFINYDKLIKHPKRWVCFRRWVDEEEEKEIRRRAEIILNKPYDFSGIIFWPVPIINVQDKKKFYCSEACYYAETGQIKKIHPVQYYKYLKQFKLTKIPI